jgi:hypothetical protein
MSPGTSTTVNVSLQAQNGFDGTATVAISGLPDGLTVVPSSPFSLTAAGQVLNFDAGSSVPDGNYTISLQASSGTLSASASASLSVAPPASFSVVPSKNNLTVQYGSSVSTTISFAPGTGATDYTLQLAVSNLPGGITASFSPNPVSPNSQSTLAFTAPAEGLPVSNLSVTITATRSTDAARQSAQLDLSTLAPASPPTSSRSDFVRTDDTPAAIAYDSTHNQILVCNPHLSRIDVVSPSSHQVVKGIPVPGAEGLTLTPDNSILYAAGPMQKLVAIDTASLAVVHQYIYPKYNGDYIDPIPVAVSNGTVLMMGYGSSGFGFFDPVTGNINGNTQQNGCLLGNVIARSGDGTKVFIASFTAPGEVSLIDVASASCIAQREFRDFTFLAAANQNGTQFAVAVSEEGIYFLDANMNTLGMAPVGGLTSGMVYSPDGRYLFIVSNPTGYLAIISTVDTQTFQLVGTAPAYQGTGNTLDGGMEIPMAAEPTGILFGAAGYGLALDDSTFYRNFPATAQYPGAFGAQPAEGDPHQSTPVTFPSLVLSGPPIVWFGANQATSVSLSTSALQATAPPSAVSGPVNVRIFDPDGAAVIMPQVFSYGPAAVTYGSLAAGPQGGATVDLFGNGFSADVQGAAINVQMGGQAAPVTKADNSLSYELSLQHLQVTAPSGSPGVQDITISAPTGTTTIPKGFHILESVQDYSTTDTLLDVLYDQSRQQLYLSAGNHVDVFSLTSSAFLPPITPPSVGGSRQMAGLALTPDSSRLLVANVTDNSVAVIDLDKPAAASAVTIVPPGTFGSPLPYQVAVTNQNNAFIGTSQGTVFVLNLSTLQASPDTDPALFWAWNGDGIGSWISSSRDGSAACISSFDITAGSIVIWTAATNTWVAQHYISSALLDSSVSGDGNIFSALGLGYPANVFDLTFVDSQGNIVGTAGLPDFRRAVSQDGSSSYLDGHRLNDSGSLIYIPFPQGIDIFDVQHGDLRERISLTEQMSIGIAGSLATRIIHSMAIDETGQHIYLITNKGLTIAQLDSVPLSIGSVTPASGGAGTQVKIRGSGFVAGTTATANGTSAAVSFVDTDTLQVVLPMLPSGAVQITLTNPDGQTYTLDDSFTVQ